MDVLQIGMPPGVFLVPRVTYVGTLSAGAVFSVASTSFVSEPSTEITLDQFTIINYLVPGQSAQEVVSDRVEDLTAQIDVPANPFLSSTEPAKYTSGLAFDKQ